METWRSGFALVLAAAVVAPLSAARPARAAAPGAFDYYLLEQSWLPEFCTGTVARKPTQMPHPECRDVESRFGATHPTVHGLWPQDDEGGYPSMCDGSPGCRNGAACPFDGEQLDADLVKQLEDKWMPGYPNLARHEWTEHGTCTGLDQHAYFAALASVAAEVPASTIPTDRIGQDVDLAELRAWWGAPRPVFLCDRRNGKQFLSAVRTCWQRSADSKPGARFACPPDVHDTCSTAEKVVLARAKNVSEDGPSPEQPSRRTSCRKPGQGPPCARDDACVRAGWLRCARSGCCTNVPK